MDAHPKAFLCGIREAARLMPDGGRVVAITYAAGGGTGSWQPYMAQGTAKIALESLSRYFAVTLAPRGITVNAISPGRIEQYRRQLRGVDRMVNPPKFSQLGHHLINKNGIGRFRKQF